MDVSYINAPTDTANPLTEMSLSGNEAWANGGGDLSSAEILQTRTSIGLLVCK